MRPTSTDEQLRRQLDLPSAPAGLRQRLMEDLDAQHEDSVRGRAGPVIMALAAALMLGVAVWLAVPVGDPAGGFIPVLQAHASAERQLRGDRSGGIDAWLDSQHITRLPEGFVTEMAKNCVVGGLHLKHLRVAGPGRAVTNLFIERSGDLASSRLEDGVGPGWLVVHPRPGITVLALFAQQDGPAGVGRLINAMFLASDSA